MPKFKVWQSRCLEIEVEATNEDEAIARALSIPSELWEDNYELELGTEQLIEEVTND